MSPTTLSVHSILQTISDEVLGFRFGKPDRPSEGSLACILPILRETSQRRQYTTLPETEKLVISDSGSIYKLNFKNTSKENIYLRSGTIFQGKGTQSRALTRSAVIFPGDEVGLDVRCVHQSHAIRSDAKFEYGGVTPFSVESSNYAAGYRPRDQQSMWDSVRHYSNTVSCSMGGQPERPVTSGRLTKSAAPLRSFRDDDSFRPIRVDSIGTTETNTGTTPWFNGGLVASDPGGAFFVGANSAPEAFAFAPAADNLKQSFDEFAKNFDGILSKARLHDNQAGLALITDTGCKSVEAFDVPVSWEALHKDAVTRMGTELLRGEDKDSVFQYKPENAINAVKKVLALPFKSNRIFVHEPSNGEPKVEIFGLTAGRYVGEVVELDSRVIHLVVFETVA